jgi:hypothetical protein
VVFELYGETEIVHNFAAHFAMTLSPDEYKKFWEELIAYFPWYYTGHIENDASNNSSIVPCVLVIAATFLPSRCLATRRGFLPSRCLATIRGLLPSRCVATVRGDTHTQTAT